MPACQQSNVLFDQIVEILHHSHSWIVKIELSICIQTLSGWLLCILSGLWYFILICYLYHASRITIMAIKYTNQGCVHVWFEMESLTCHHVMYSERGEPYWDWHITSQANWKWLHIILSLSQLDGFQSTVLEILSFQSIEPLEKNWVQVIVTVWHSDVWRVMACCSSYRVSVTGLAPQYYHHTYLQFQDNESMYHCNVKIIFILSYCWPHW